MFPTKTGHMKSKYIIVIIFFFSKISSGQQTTVCAATCIAPEIDNCVVSGISKVSSFKSGFLYTAPVSCSDGLCAGSVWRFPEITTYGGGRINATITIDAAVNARLEMIDDDDVTDAEGVVKTSLLAPRIKPDIALGGTDRNGYVQFTIRFFAGGVGDGYSLLLNLANLSVYNYDIDGNTAGDINIGGNGSWYRETSLVKYKETDNPIIQFDPVTELNIAEVNAGGDKWMGSISGICEKPGLSGCAQNTAAARFSKPQYSVSFRIGYDYNAGGTIGQPESQFGIKLGCFNVPAGIHLPVNMYDFTAKRNSGVVQLEWTTTYEYLNQGFRVQRKTNSSEFTDIAFIPSLSPDGNSQINLTYRYNDNNTFKGVSQYRIVQTDYEGKIRVSETRSVTGEESKSNLVIFPNPVSSDGTVTIVFENSRSLRDAVLCNNMGLPLKKWPGISGNTITLEKLVSGVYFFKVINNETGEIQLAKFVVN
jgi:hypothetical protein